MPTARNVTALSKMEQSARVGGGCSQVVQLDSRRYLHLSNHGLLRPWHCDRAGSNWPGIAKRSPNAMRSTPGPIETCR